MRPSHPLSKHLDRITRQSRRSAALVQDHHLATKQARAALRRGDLKTAERWQKVAMRCLDLDRERQEAVDRCLRKRMK
jgi:Tfp pilus assembly protein PilX